MPLCKSANEYNIVRTQNKVRMLHTVTPGSLIINDSIINSHYDLNCYFLSNVVAPAVTAISANLVLVTFPDPVSFNCTVDSYPPSTITWLHNGAEVQAAPPRVTISTVQVDNRTQESTLTLLNTTAEDIGTYTCSAVNTKGMTSTTTELRVLGECKPVQGCQVQWVRDIYFCNLLTIRSA